jgi:hypothetical protein
MTTVVTSNGRMYWVVAGVVYIKYTDALSAARSR